MCLASDTTTRRAVLLRRRSMMGAAALTVAAFAVSMLHAQNAAAASTAQVSEPVGTAQGTTKSQSTQAGEDPAFSTPPVAIVPLDQSIPGAALAVAGPLQAWNGRAYLTSNGTITAGEGTAQVTLPYRGTLRVCASSTVKLAADSDVKAGQVPGLLIALDHGAVEMSFAASAARERSADTLLTPYFRILIGGPAAADLKVRLGQQGDTCVDNAGSDAPYVVVTSVFDDGIYRVEPGQRVMFEHGNLHEVVDQEKEPCGCPPPPKAQPNEFPLAQSEGLAPGSKAPVAAIKAPAGNDRAATTMVYNSGEHAPQTVMIPGPDSSQAVAATAKADAPMRKAQKKPGFFRRIGRFFKRVFGAE